ncbi:hypothetical protein, partial [Rhizobium johnstonii]|uniref:hypothetical protein n=1 Tax=Rhizobium johnstonii TaxID=3019933 RepID=UPI003F9E7982
MLTLTGAKLLHEGQFEGATTILPIFLGRRPVASVDCDLSAFYARLAQAPFPILEDIAMDRRQEACIE